MDSVSSAPTAASDYFVVAPTVPFAPEGVNIDERIARVRRAFRRFGPLSWLWLLFMVWPNHAWDDKVVDNRCEDFGNFAVGAVLHAAHLPLNIGLRAAGAVTMNADQIDRWLAFGLTKVEAGFRRVPGYRQLANLERKVVAHNSALQTPKH